MSSPASSAGPRPCWTVLPPVPLMGVGTELVESVEHYASRLAWIAGIGVSELCALPPPFDEPGAGNPGGTNRFCGPGQTYQRRIQNLEALTGVETIRCGSFIVLDELLALGAIGRSSSRHRWCPECYLAWDAAESWEPLIWTVDLLTTCPIHGCNLEFRCRQCQATQRITAKHQQRRWCRTCRASLAGRGEVVNWPRHYGWTQRQLYELVRFCATPGQVPIRLSAYELFVGGVARLSVDAVSMPAPVRAAVAHIRSKVTSSRVTLRTLINLCALQGVSVVESLVDPVAASSRPLIDLWNGYQSLEFPAGRHTAKLTVYRECLSEVMRTCEGLYLPSMRFLLREIKLNRDLARELSVDLYEAYEQAHRQQGSPNTLTHAERTFRWAMSLVKTSDVHRDSASYIRRVAGQAAAVANVSLQQAERITRAALYSQTALEQAKAKQLTLAT